MHNYIKDLNYKRHHQICLARNNRKGVYVYNVNKRAWTGYCEVCGRIVKGKRDDCLHYHHWDNEDLVPGKDIKGIWVCQLCHYVCEMVEKGEDDKLMQKIQRYKELKKMINQQIQEKNRVKPNLN